MKYTRQLKLISLTALLGTTIFALPGLSHERNKSRDFTPGDEVRTLNEFDTIVLKGSADINVEAGKSQNVHISTNDNESLPDIETEVRGKTLYISQRNGHWRNVEVVFDIQVQNFNGIIIKGSGDVTGKNIDSENFEVEIKGSGDVNLSGTSKNYEVTVRGSGDVYLEGGCGSISATLQGSGDINSEDLKCESAKLTHQGSGNLDIFASETLEVTLGGSGDVMVYGSPRLNRLRGGGSGDFEIVYDK